MIILFDRAQITKRERTPEGYLKVTARIARSGIYEYTRRDMGATDGNPFEKVRIYRPPDEVFSDEALRSFALKPVTDNHPPEFVTTENYKNYAVGFTGETVERDGDYVRATLVITDANSIKRIEGGKVELSAGYQLELELTPGKSPDGAAYDAVQRTIRGNHIALVDAGRCGSNCRLDDNALEGECEDPENCECASCQARKQKDGVMTNTNKTVMVDGLSVEVTDHVAQVIDRVVKQRDEANERNRKLTDQMYETSRTLNDRISKLELDVNQAKSAVSAENQAKMADERIDLITRAMDFLPDEYDTKGKTNAQIARDAVSSVLGSDAITGKSDEYVLARLDALDSTSVTDAPANRLASALTPRGRANQPQDNGQAEYQRRLSQQWMPQHLRDAMAVKQ